MIKGLMQCWCCSKEMVWGGDNMVDEEDMESGIVSNFSCECGSSADFYHPTEEGKLKQKEAKCQQE